MVTACTNGAPRRLAVCALLATSMATPSAQVAQIASTVPLSPAAAVTRESEPILPSKLASKGSGAGLPPAIPQGLRAVSVRVNEVIGVAGYVLPGTRVDVLAIANATDARADVTSKVVLTNVQVLAAGTKIEQDGGGKPMPVNVVTMLVTPEQAERLALASTEGKIQLALRNPLDQGSPDTPGIKPAMLLGLSSPVRPAVHAVRHSAAPVPPPPEPSVEVIRGDKRAIEVIR